MNPEAITITRSDGSRLDFDTNFFAFAKSDNGTVITACKASKTDIFVGTAILNVNILEDLLSDPGLSSWRRMRIIARHLRLWVETFFKLYKAAAKEAHHE